MKRCVLLLRNIIIFPRRYIFIFFKSILLYRNLIWVDIRVFFLIPRHFCPFVTIFRFYYTVHTTLEGPQNTSRPPITKTTGNIMDWVRSPRSLFAQIGIASSRFETESAFVVRSAETISAAITARFGEPSSHPPLPERVLRTIWAGRKTRRIQKIVSRTGWFFFHHQRGDVLSWPLCFDFTPSFYFFKSYKGAPFDILLWVRIPTIKMMHPCEQNNHILYNSASDGPRFAAKIKKNHHPVPAAESEL